MQARRGLLSVALLVCACAKIAICQQADADRDGLSDALEQRLLQQFEPSFQIARNDCSGRPAEFEPGVRNLAIQVEDGAIYGQVFLSKSSTPQHPVAEIHFYHLWRLDCGRHGHPFDTEHVATLIQADGPDLDTASWHAAYWFAAAHENTVCDVSQIARATTLHAEDHGATVWISNGKHASYLNETLCNAGCGNDRCSEMSPLPQAPPINLGEPGHPMNGSLFIASTQWPLAGKMSTSNFPAGPIARLEQLPATDIGWYNPGRHPAQGIIAISSHTEAHIANAGTNPNTAMSLAGDNTSDAISSAQDHTGNALLKSYRKTTHALGSAIRHTGGALHVTPKDPKPDQPR
jgi:hypothetical protein